jgi:hypothetical protein
MEIQSGTGQVCIEVPKELVEKLCELLYGAAGAMDCEYSHVKHTYLEMVALSEALAPYGLAFLEAEEIQEIRNRFANYQHFFPDHTQIEALEKDIIEQHRLHEEKNPDNDER